MWMVWRRDGWRQSRQGGRVSSRRGLVLLVAGLETQVQVKKLKGARRHVAKVLMVAVLGALAMLPAGNPAHANPGDVCKTENENRAGYQLPTGKYICDLGITVTYYNSGYHAFVVGSDYKVWHTWTTSSGAWRSTWESLGGTSKSRVYLTQGTKSGRNYVNLYVLGTTDTWYCKAHNGTHLANAWWPSKTTWATGQHCE
ncbi:hypothetical protein ACFFRK_08670 [Amorphoplanes digitatis]|uniref:hypothetical protein n=1 Tax=Actinoplanes digitatis TaxID=1868 RepID=UPI0019414A4C|nr:hypothetical protein [Actinoplanes digitatis]